MALVRLETNVFVAEAKAMEINRKLASAVAKVTGTPPGDMRVEIAGNRRMRMAEVGDEPLAHVQVRGVDFPKERAAELTNAICPALLNGIGVQDSRVYIAVISDRNSMWRVNGDAGKRDRAS